MIDFLRPMLVLALVISGVLCATGAPAQEFRTPLAITGATVVLAPGESVEHATILIKDGRIAAVGAEVAIPDIAERFDATGLIAYAGFTDGATHLGIEAKGPSDDEMARLRDKERAFSEGPHTAMEQANRQEIWPHLTLFDLYKQNDDALKAHRAKMEDIEAFLRESQHYARAHGVPGAELTTDVRLAAMAPCVRGEKPVFFRADSYKAILQSLAFADTFGLKPIILGGGEAWKCAQLLAEKKVPVIVTSVFREAAGKYDRFDAFYTNPARLEQAGVLFSIASDGTQFARQLPLHAGYAVAYGLSPGAGLRAITIDAAKILGVDGQIGSLEAGKIADVIITTGDPLQANTRTIGMFMAGKPVELSSLHERSYERFSKRPAPPLSPVGELRGPKPMRAAPAAPARAD